MLTEMAVAFLLLASTYKEACVWPTSRVCADAS